jgi:hypothetical protein
MWATSPTCGSAESSASELPTGTRYNRCVSGGNASLAPGRQLLRDRVVEKLGQRGILSPPRAVATDPERLG